MKKTQVLPGRRKCESGCITHEGPCWLHTYLSDWGWNLELLEKAPTHHLALIGFAQAEHGRLTNMLRDMQAAGMTETETVPVFLARTGWAPDVIAAYERRRDELQAREHAAFAQLRRITETAQEEACTH